MRRGILGGFAGLIFCLAVLPALLVRGCAPRDTGRTGLGVSIYLVRARRLVRMDLEAYLVGVVAAEMPAHFSGEALKAQAVAARTVALRRMRRFGGRGCRHTQRADLCDQPEDGQAWLAEADLRRAWGWNYGRYRARVVQAVRETRGLVLLYEHKPIDAAYHSTCGGRTEDAELVWGRPIPYLRGVPCGFDSFSPRYRTEIRLTRNELARRLALKVPAAGLGLRVLARTPSGRVSAVLAGGKVFTGAAFRQAAGLRSTSFTVRTEGDKVVFLVRGYGHGVGLCQYGAEGMARKGAAFVQILRHYYTGVTLGRIKEQGRD